MKRWAMGLLVLVGATGLLAVTSPASTAVSCTDAGIVVQVVNPSSGETLSGGVILEAHATANSGLRKVEFWGDGSLIGVASQGTETSHWRLPWDTRSTPNGEHRFFAKAFYQPPSPNPVYECRSAEVEARVDNPAPITSTLHVELMPPSWQGPTNVPYGFTAKAVLKLSNGQTHDVTPSAAYMWSTNLGSLKPDGNRATYFSGPTPGEGFVRVKAAYDGRTAEATSPVRVYPGSTSSTYPSEPPPSGGSGTSSSPSGSSGTGTTEPPPSGGGSASGDPELAGCLKSELGEARYQQITSGQRPTVAELERAKVCLARRSFIIPANLAPLPPANVRSLLSLPAVIRVEKAENKEVEVGEGKQTAIQLSGRSLPNKTVLIYVFSEPLVMVAQTDSDGHWTYTVDSPLEPGQHEVYVAVEQDDGQFVRSAPFFISVAQAASTSENPAGNGSTLEQPTLMQWRYALFAGGAILFGLVFVVALQRVRRRLRPA